MSSGERACRTCGEVGVLHGEFDGRLCWDALAQPRGSQREGGMEHIITQRREALDAPSFSSPVPAATCHSVSGTEQTAVRLTRA